jgi:hypothetical protein
MHSRIILCKLMFLKLKIINKLDIYTSTNTIGMSLKMFSWNNLMQYIVDKTLHASFKHLFKCNVFEQTNIMQGDAYILL